MAIEWRGGRAFLAAVRDMSTTCGIVAWKSAGPISFHGYERIIRGGMLVRIVHLLLSLLSLVTEAWKAASLRGPGT